MLSGRPLLYLSLPGVALILGVFWYRRRNKNDISNNNDRVDSKDSHNYAKDLNIDDPAIDLQSMVSIQPTKSVNIISNINSTLVDDENCSTKVFGKSAPIKILQNSSRSSSAKAMQPQRIDSDILRSKIEDAEHKTLRSIDEDFENLSSPVDLPDSISHRMSFYARNVNCNKDQPVVIKATNTPKISPENSFLESKYINSSEPNNNCKVENTESTLELNKNKTQMENLQESNQRQFQIEHNKIVSINIVNGIEKRSVEAASPSLSLCSVQSGDSGKGSSLPRSEATRAKTTYEFLYPVCLLGYLHGRQRSFVNKIKAKTNADVTLRRYPYSAKVRVCVIEGTEVEINAALDMIRQRVPAKRYPNFTMQRIHYALPQTIVPLSTQSLLNLQLNLIEGINNDVVVSAVISGNHVFVQHPLHPTHPSLAVLQKCLYDSYTNTETPMLPCIEVSAVCVLQVNGMWYRVQIVEQDPDEEHLCVVKLLDFGGYINAQFNDLRQIRTDFMGLPFQATECILSNIEPSDCLWYPESAEILCKLTHGIVLQAQVAGYNSHNIPEIYLFACLGPNNVIFINKELVARNLAKWVDIRE